MNQKFFNKFSRSHNQLRKFLKLVAHGCYHRMLFRKNEISPRTYDDCLRQLRFFIAEDKIKSTYNGKHAYFTFVGDYRRESENFFAASYLLKSFTGERCLQYISLLQMLGNSSEPLAFNIIQKDLGDKLSFYVKEKPDANYVQLIRRRLNELVDAELLRQIRKGGNIFYEVIKNPLEGLTASEAIALKSAVDFYKNTSLTEIIGYFLAKTLDEMYPEVSAKKNIFRFKNNNLTRILDDEILFDIIGAMNGGTKTVIDYNGKKMTISPLKIETDFLLNRQYLSAVCDVGKIPQFNRLRVDKITAVKSTTKKIDDSIKPSRKILREIKLRVVFENAAERLSREKILRKLGEMKILEENEKFFICTIGAEDTLQIYPLLWRVQPWAEILSENLRERMLNDVNEVLKNYGYTV